MGNIFYQSLTCYRISFPLSTLLETGFKRAKLPGVRGGKARTQNEDFPLDDIHSINKNESDKAPTSAFYISSSISSPVK